MSKQIIKKIHLTLTEVKDKIENLTGRLKEMEGPHFRKKRQNIFQKLAKLKKYTEDPDKYLARVEENKMRKDKDKMKRISKKIAKKERRLDELRRDKNRSRKLQCLICKQRGHRMKDCSQLGDFQMNSNVCYNCGSTEHSLSYCTHPKGDTLPFANCFICKEKGHLSKNCSQNTNGIFYKGGGCFFCGSNMHKKMDCPKWNKTEMKKKQDAKQYEFDFEQN